MLYNRQLFFQIMLAKMLRVFLSYLCYFKQNWCYNWNRL